MSDEDLTLTEPPDEVLEAILGGISIYQMKALSAGAIPKVEAAGDTLMLLAEENPELIRRTFLQNQDAFKVAMMPDEMLEHLDLELRDGTLYENTDGDGWTEVEVE